MSEPMDVQAQDLEELNRLYNVNSLLTNMATNLNLIEQGANGQVITVNNVNLYQLAVKYYNDATKWTAIAEANGLSDPIVQATINISVSGLFMTFTGFAESSQMIRITIFTSAGSTTYIYQVSTNDTLQSVVIKVSELITGSTYSGNVITLQPYNTIAPEVLRFVNLTIPQSAIDTGGIWEN